MSGIIDEAPEKPAGTPRVLTRNIIPVLTQDLDASDVLECYALVRNAPLHGIANSTLHINKMALGLRYRPSAAIGAHNKLPLELTLEYGPQRLGPLLRHEAMPFIQMEENTAFVSWENVGKVYYTKKIATTEYSGAYFMASMTGAVLNKMLVEAVDYASKRRRYQPFSVYSAENGKELRSSSSVDFTQYMWQHLANVGVEIKPILAPPIYEARVWVSGYTKVSPEPSVAQAAAIFYQKLFQCLEAIATGDYSEYMPTQQPTLSPVPTPSPTVFGNETSLPSGSPTKEEVGEGEDKEEKSDGTNGEKDTLPEEKSGGTNGEKDILPEISESLDDEDQIVNTTASNDEDDDSEGDLDGNDRKLRRRLDVEEGEASVSETEALDQPDAPETAAPSTAPSTSRAPTEVNESDDEIHDVDKAKQAAQEAQEAASEAKEAAKTEGDTKAADAAQAAATAAQKAADATSNAASQAAMDGLLSGDGSLMSSIVTTCFTNPQYDILSVDENGTALQTHAFLYRDGSMFYKLNLTSPYFEVVRVERPLPVGSNAGEFMAGGDLVDWVLAFVVIGSVLLGFLIILQQSGYYYYGPLYKCQRWLFNPGHHADEENLEQEGVRLTFGADAIPLSMGGRRSYSSPVRQTNELFQFSEGEPDDLKFPDFTNGGTTPKPKVLRAGSSLETFGDVELRRMPSPHDTKRIIRLNSLGSASSFDDELEAQDTVPTRLTRDPDLVDMPDLKSKSKIAMPAGFTDSRNNSMSSDRS